MHFQDEFGYWNTIAGVNTGSRILVVQAVTLDESSPIAERFVSKFKAGLSTEEAGDPTPAPTDGTVQILPPDDVGPGIGSGSGSGIGSGTGSGAGIGSGVGGGISSTAVRPPPPAGNRPIKIDVRPRPGYTELGRLYEINGTVVLRVAFLETGKIGVVSVVKGLPFGLTQQAVAAAKRITFEPQIIDGRPSSTTKAVEYSFSIY